MNNSQALKIDKRSGLSKRELFNEYIAAEKPVILTDAINRWEAFGKITPQFLKENYPEIQKEINGTVYKMKDYVDLMLNTAPGTITPYPFNFNVEKCFPELLKWMKPEILYAKSDRVNHRLMPKFMLGNTHAYEIFLGGKGSRWPTLHFDALYMHTQITQLYGAKTFFLYPPDQTPFLYPNPEWPKSSLVDIFSPDYNKFPLYKNAKGVTVTVEHGETILFPKGWWHTTEMDSPSISLGRIQLNASNWRQFLTDNDKEWKRRKKKFRSLVYLYGRGLGHVMNIQEKIITGRKN